MEPTSSVGASSHHFPPTTSSPPFSVSLASAIVSASRRSWPAMKEAFCGSPVQVLMSMMSRAWLSRVRRVDNCGNRRGFCRCKGYDGRVRGGGSVERRKLISYK